MCNSKIHAKGTSDVEILYENILDMNLGYVIMWIIGGILIYLAIKKDMEIGRAHV